MKSLSLKNDFKSLPLSVENSCSFNENIPCQFCVPFKSRGHQENMRRNAQ